MNWDSEQFLVSVLSLGSLTMSNSLNSLGNFLLTNDECWKWL